MTDPRRSEDLPPNPELPEDALSLDRSVETSAEGAERRERLGAGRRLAGCLDGVVRAMRAQSGSRLALAGRVVDLWLEQPTTSLVIFPTRIEVEQRTVMTAEENGSRWILPAFMSGLRSLGTEASLSVDDVLRLASELSVLSAEIDSVQAFQDWLWEDGAEGFVVELEPSFVEAIHDVESGGAQLSDFLVATRGAALAELGRTATVASEDLDRVALREEFAIPVDLARPPETSPELDAEERRAARRMLDDPSNWLRLEMEVCFEWPALRESMPAGRMARRIHAVATQGADADLIRMVRSLDERDDARHGEIATHLRTLGVMSAVVRGLSLDDAEGWRQFGEWWRTQPRAERGEALAMALRRLLDASGAGRPQQLGRFLAALGPSSWLDEISVPRLGDEASVALLTTLRKTGSRTAERILPRLITELSSERAVDLLGTLDANTFAQLSDDVGGLLSRTESPSLRDRVLERVLRSEDEAAITVLGEFLTASAGRSWRPSTLAAAIERLSSVEEGIPYLVRLIRDRRAMDRSRIAALDALERHPQARAAAAKRRLSDFSESAAMRSALVDARGQG